ncbi:helix-turn-helix domain-containing protein [Streptomyces sp. A5-4]|uniref:helix-turn-helix domain-containing protein n=1 Tax=Streptomyces sp. A5-4 TaxID=3384771 RepID=UPI003DA8A3E4
MSHPNDSSSESPLTFGQRVRRARERRGLTRAVVGGLVGRSAEWVKAIETDRLHMPRLPLLLRMADVLGVDLTAFTGDERLAVATYSKATHMDLPVVKDALTAYHFRSPEESEEPQSADTLLGRVQHGWQLWHAPGDHRSRIATIVPRLLSDLQYAARELEGAERRRVLVGLAETYHLVQLYLSFQPAGELVMLTGDRAMSAAQDADSPRAIAGAAWYMNHVFRDAGEAHEARVDLAMKAAELLRNTDSSHEELARWGLLQLAAALSYAKVGRSGEAWRHWDHASDAAGRLGEGYSHPWLIFGPGMVDAYRLTMHNDLVQSRSAIEVATNIDLAPMPSATRRSFHHVEAARAYSMEGEKLAVVHLLRKAHEESPETVRYNLFARTALPDLVANGPAIVRADAQFLAEELGVPA